MAEAGQGGRVHRAGAVVSGGACGLRGRAYRMGAAVTPANAAQAIEWANEQPARALWFSTSSGLIELALTLDDAKAGSHQGQCDADVADLRTVPYILEQLDQYPPALVAAELDEWGAWDEKELADHDANLSRLLWLACCDVREQEP